MNALKPEVMELAAQVAQVLMDGGWRQGMYGNINEIDTPHCLMGAVYAIEDFTAPDCLISKYDLSTEIMRRTGFATIVQWNDAIGRTQEEIIGVLQDIAEGR